MKKSNLIITIAVVIVLSVSSVGAILAASGVFAAGSGDAPAASQLGALTFSAESGIRWNEGNNAFEIFDAAGVSYISSNYWINHTGDYKVSTAYANEADGKAAGFSQASPLKTYHIMQDIVYPTLEEGETITDKLPAYYIAFNVAAPNLGSETTGSSVGVLDGKGYTLYNFPVRTPAVLFNFVYGTIKNMTVDIGNVEVTLGAHFGTICGELYGNVIDVVTKGSLVNHGTFWLAGFVVEVRASASTTQSSGLVLRCSNHIDILAASATAAGGIVVNSSGLVVDCVNYGLVTAPTHVRGIGCGSADTAQYIGCVNYGKVIATRTTGNSYATGIAYITSGAAATVVSCINYGRVECLTSGTGVAVGILSKASIPINTSKAANNKNHGELIGASTWDLYLGVA